MSRFSARRLAASLVLPVVAPVVLTFAACAIAVPCLAASVSVAGGFDPHPAPACSATRPEPVNGRPVVGLVLSGGGARGAAHVGVLKVIEELGVPVDLVVGTSMGSVVGAMYASGMPVEDIERVVGETDWPAVLSDGPPYRELSAARKNEKRDFQLGGRLGIGRDGTRLPSGLREGQNVRLMLRGLFPQVADVRCFNEFAIPFAAVATNAANGSAVILDHGDIVDALRASMAIPAYLSPVEIDRTLLVDGGPANNMPVSIARAMGADIVIAVDISTPFSDQEKLRSLFSISMQMTTMLARSAADEERKRLRPDDILIVPALDEVQTLDFDKMGIAVTAGEKAARKALTGSRIVGRADAVTRPSVKFAQRYRTANAPFVLGEVTVAGNAVLPPRQITGRFALQPGQRIDHGQIRKGITRVYGLDYFSTVDYHRVPDGDHDNLVLDVRRREWGPTYLQFGLGIYDNFQGITRTTLGASLTATQVNRFTGQFRLQGNLGSVQRLFAEFYQPVNRGASFFVAPWAVYDKHVFDVYANRAPLASLRASTQESALDVGWAGRHGEMRVGYATGERRLESLIGVGGVPTFTTETGYVHVLADLDRQDDRDFPTYGTKLTVLSENGRRALGSAGEFDHVVASGSVAFAMGNQHFLAAFSAETLDANALAPLEPPHIGGPMNLSAFNPGELLGDNVGDIRLTTWRPANEIPFFQVYVGGGLEFGGAWNGAFDASDRRQLWPVATLFTAAATPIGPIFLVGGLSENGFSAVHFQLGYRY